jgi:hypothetical protein
MKQVFPSDVVSFIDQSFDQGFNPGTTIMVNDFTVPRLEAVIKLVGMVPEHLLLLNSLEYSAFVAAIADLRARIDSFQIFDVRDRLSQLMPLVPMTAFGNRISLQVLRDQLAKCPDEVPTPATAALKFIVDSFQRETLRVDLSTVANSLANNEWKAATILSGSLIEALLLWAIKQRTTDVSTSISGLVKSGAFKGRPAPDPADPDNWKLFQYILVARELKEIEPRTATIADEARDFRNLIHPGLTIRSGQTCTRGTAYAAYGAVQLVIEDLTRAHPQ